MFSCDQHCHVGTSGWNYPHWYGRFYPASIGQNELLSCYSRHFSTVEINNSFYRLPTVRTVRRWAADVPGEFVFSVKASRYITHMKKLKDPAAGLSRFLSTVGELGKKLGVVLFQLPPRWNFNEERLSDFLTALPVRGRYAFEFRDFSWYNQRCRNLLREHNCATCVFELAGKRSPLWVTADFVYVRLHGPDDAYQGRYTPEALRTWAGRMRRWRRKGCEIFCYFDNDQNAYAAVNAEYLNRMLN